MTRSQNTMKFDSRISVMGRSAWKQCRSGWPKKPAVGERSGETATRVIDGARARPLAEGYAGPSTRHVADLAGVRPSQIHYHHFGGEQGPVLDDENRRPVERQRRMYGADAALWRRYEQACDLLGRRRVRTVRRSLVGVIRRLEEA